MNAELITSYINGNWGTVREEMKRRKLTLADIIEEYTETENPTQRDLVLIIKRLAR